MKKTQKKEHQKLGIQPMADRVLIKTEEPKKDKKNDFGIIIPDTVSKERPEQGLVVAIGHGKVNDNGELIPMRVKVGDNVIFSKYGYEEVKVDGEDYILVSESNLLAIVK